VSPLPEEEEEVVDEEREDGLYEEMLYGTLPPVHTLDVYRF